MKISLIFLVSFCGLVNNEEIKVKYDNDCEPGESCVRLCCALNAPEANCSDLELMPVNKKLQKPHKIIRGAPCNEMVFDDENDTWEFLPVSYKDFTM